MSLINDALRRAKQAHRETAPTTTTPDPHFRPVDPALSTRRGVGLLLPALLGAVALLGLVLFWELAHRDASPTAGGPLAVAARTPEPSALALPRVAVAAPASRASAMIKPDPSAAFNPVPEPATNPPAPESVPKRTAAGQSDTNQPAAVEPAAPALAPLKLQGITYNPRRPSAMINGRVVFLGDRVREYRVLNIRPDEVVLTGAGRTNVLSLEP